MRKLLKPFKKITLNKKQIAAFVAAVPIAISIIFGFFQIPFVDRFFFQPETQVATSIAATSDMPENTLNTLSEDMIKESKELVENVFIRNEFYLQVITDEKNKVLRTTLTTRDENFRPLLKTSFTSERISLGTVTFADIEREPSVIFANTAMFLISYFEAHYAGNPGNYQTTILGTNVSGWKKPSGGDNFAYMEDIELRNKSIAKWRKLAHINTIGMTSPDVGMNYPQQTFFGVGPDYYQVRAISLDKGASPDEINTATTLNTGVSLNFYTSVFGEPEVTNYSSSEIYTDLNSYQDLSDFVYSNESSDKYQDNIFELAKRLKENPQDETIYDKYFRNIRSSTSQKQLGYVVSETPLLQGDSIYLSQYPLESAGERLFESSLILCTNPQIKKLSSLDFSDSIVFSGKIKEVVPEYLILEDCFLSMP